MVFLRRLFRRKSKPVNLTICGLDKAVKTTYLNYLIEEEFKETAPTMGLNRKTISFPNLDIHIFDLGGEDFRPLWTDINEKTNALIYVVDSTDYLWFEETKEIFHNIIKNQINPEIPVLLIILSKINLPDRMERV